MFELTVLEARDTAKNVRTHFLRQRFSVDVERPAWPDAPYRTTLVCKRLENLLLIECQASLDYHSALRGLHERLVEEVRPAELYIALGSGDGSVIPTAALRSLERDGVGLVLVDERGGVVIDRPASNWAYFASPDPNLRYGALKGQVESAFHKYNRVNRLDGARDLASLVEGETRKLARLAFRRGWLGGKPISLASGDWSGLINLLGSNNAVVEPYPVVIEEPLKNDLHSFRGGRNLVGHPATSPARLRRDARQLKDRMLLGARLVAELDARRRSVAAFRAP
ncbi:MAG: hypothetical protein WAK40_02130 [Thermoplasmata archaeon]